MKTLAIHFSDTFIVLNITDSIKIFDLCGNRDFCSIGLFVVNNELYKIALSNSKIHFCVFEDKNGIIDCVIDLKEKPQSIYID